MSKTKKKSKNQSDSDSSSSSSESDNRHKKSTKPVKPSSSGKEKDEKLTQSIWDSPQTSRHDEKEKRRERKRSHDEGEPIRQQSHDRRNDSNRKKSPERREDSHRERRRSPEPRERRRSPERRDDRKKSPERRRSPDRREDNRRNRQSPERRRHDNSRDERRDNDRRKRSHSKERPSYNDRRGGGGFRNKRFNKDEDDGNYDWGKRDVKKDPDEAPVDKEAPNFGLSGKLTEDTNKFNGVVIKYAEPPEAKKPKRRWRFYPFKGETALPTLYIHRQSAYLIGRDRKICDLAVDHPSCSKQHAALQYRLVPYERDDGSTGKRVRPYIIDLESANGTFVNNKKIDPKKYVELLEKDVIKFGFSSREYVLLHETSKDEAEDDEVAEETEAAKSYKTRKLRKFLRPNHYLQPLNEISETIVTTVTKGKI